MCDEVRLTALVSGNFSVFCLLFIFFFFFFFHSSAFLGTGGKYFGFLFLFLVGFFCDFINRMKKTDSARAKAPGYVTAVKADELWGSAQDG